VVRQVWRVALHEVAGARHRSLPVQRGAKSISHETTFDVDIHDEEELERTLSYLSQLVARRLRDHRLFARTIGLKLRYASFRTLTRDVTVDEPTHLDSVIFENVLRLFESNWNRKQKIRLLASACRT